MVPQSSGSPCPLRQTTPSQPCILVIIISTLTVSVMGYHGYYHLDALNYHRVHSNTDVIMVYGCSHHQVHSNTNGSTAWAWMLSSSSALEHERYDGFGMDALVTVCSWNMNVILVWTWMLSTSSALEHKHNYGLGMDALNIECTRTQT